MSCKVVGALLACGTLFAAPAPAAQRWGSGPVPNSGACFYQLPNYRGEYFCARTGDELASLPDDLNNHIGSIRVFGGARVVLYSYRRFDGAERWIDYNVPDLQYDGWYDRIGSARLSWEPRYASRDDRYYDGRPRGTSGSYQARSGEGEDSRYPDNGAYPGDRRMMTRAQAQAIVRSAYLNVLQREPDPASAPWVDRVMSTHMSQQQLENELRKSPEYRSRNR
jgi:hypothetical protein